MRTKIGLPLVVGTLALLAGCRATLEGSVWLPDFSSLQASGTGGTELDLDNQLGVVPDEQVYVYDIIGDAGRNRVRLDYWKIHGEGLSSLHGGFNFDTLPYPAGDNVETTMDLEAIGVLWEPALIKTEGFRLRIAAGFDLIRFRMDVEDLDDPAFAGTVEVPGPDSPMADAGLEYMPVPKVGLGFEAEISPWVRIHARAQMFDASYLNLDEDFEGKFTHAVAGLVFGKHRGFRLFAGYRFFNADYRFENDSGDSTLKGPMATLSIRF